MIKNFDEFINESSYHIPFDEIYGENGKHLAGLPFVVDEMDYVKYPRYEFKIATIKEIKDFEGTTVSRDFWLAIYDYDCLEVERKNDYTLINANMKKFRNIIVGKNLYIYVCNPSDVNELKQRCQKAAKTYNFKSVNFIE
ncbi:MAG: hypothetical protein IKO36_12720 [Bacteroidaceae bacterium]|nr:hypothetical protein [Bacteroidaceae bacterium]